MGEVEALDEQTHHLCFACSWKILLIDYNDLYRFSLLKLEMTPEVFLQPSRQPYTIIGNDWWNEAQPQANTGSPFKGVCFICFALSFDYFFVSCVASNKIQRALLEDILPRFAATMNSPIILVLYDLFLTYIACW